MHEFTQGEEHGTNYVVTQFVPTSMTTKKTWVNVVGATYSDTHNAPYHTRIIHHIVHA